VGGKTRRAGRVSVRTRSGKGSANVHAGEAGIVRVSAGFLTKGRKKGGGKKKKTRQHRLEEKGEVKTFKTLVAEKKHRGSKKGDWHARSPQQHGDLKKREGGIGKKNMHEEKQSHTFWEGSRLTRDRNEEW